MANVFTKTAALLTLAMYLGAVAGFDVHSCSDNGHVYIEPLIAGISCDDIHPDTPCNEGHGAGCHCHDGEDCCSDSIEVLQLSGDNTRAVHVPLALFHTIASVFHENGLPAPYSVSKTVTESDTDPPGLSPDIYRYCVIRA